MGSRGIKFSGYKAMWLFAMFDLPVATKKERRIATQFRKALLKEGFSMIQFSVYIRFCPSEEVAQTYRARLRHAVPPKGEVRILSVTDRQFGKMDVFWGEKRVPAEEPPVQLMLF